MKIKFISVLIVVSFLLVGISTNAQTIYGNGGDLNLFVCDVLGSIGLGCGAPQTVQSSTPVPVVTSAPAAQSPTTRQQANINNNLQASIANVTVKRTASDNEVILVKVSVPIAPGNRGSSTEVGTTNGYKQTFGLSTNDAIFEIIRGQKHFIPTVDIFFDYGFDLSAVQSVTHKDLDQFPRTKLADVHKNGKGRYYITEGNMIRLIPNERVFESYGDREEDVITISKKEFNFYPRSASISFLRIR